MTKQKSLKKSLAKSAVAMTLCAGMLVGSTYAWFSDSASTATSTITAGNLDIALYVDGEESTKEAPKELFEKLPELWEPGMMVASKPFYLKNNGSLWLTYELTANVVKEKAYTWPVDSKFADETVKLSDVVKMAVVTNSTYKTYKTELSNSSDYTARKNAWDKMLETDGITDTSISSYSVVSTLGPKAGGSVEDSRIVVLFWEADPRTELTNPDNKYNLPADADTTLKFENLGLNVFATQTPEEEDSFGPNYDNATAIYSNVTLEEGKTLVIPDNITNDNAEGMIVRGSGTLDFNGKTVSNKQEGAAPLEIKGDETEIVIEGEGTIKATPYTNGINASSIYALEISYGADVTINSGTLVGGIYVERGKCTINGGTIKTPEEKTVGKTVLQVQNDLGAGALTINHLTIEGKVYVNAKDVDAGRIKLADGCGVKKSEKADIYGNYLLVAE